MHRRLTAARYRPAMPRSRPRPAPTNGSRTGRSHARSATPSSVPPARVQRRNATFQHWQTLLTNRTKRHRAGEMLVQGVRPITLAIEHGHRVRTLLVDEREHLSTWARDLVSAPPAPVVQVAPELMAELGERTDGPPELLAIVEIPQRSLASLSREAGPVLVFDRPSSPGNLGSLARSADALGAAALVISGHSADPWDPAAVRASTGSVFSVPIMQVDGPDAVLDWARPQHGAAPALPVIGTDEHGDVILPDAPLRDPAVVVIGNETRGMSARWRDACDLTASIPMGGSASSLNAAAAGTVVLYEALRQRRDA